MQWRKGASGHDWFAGASSLNSRSLRHAQHDRALSPLVPAWLPTLGAVSFHPTMDPKQIVHSDPDILGGTPVFVGTRVPVDALIDFLEGGDTIEDFLENYPGVSREQVFAFLEEASRALLAEIA